MLYEIKLLRSQSGICQFHFIFSISIILHIFLIERPFSYLVFTRQNQEIEQNERLQKAVYSLFSRMLMLLFYHLFHTMNGHEMIVSTSWNRHRGNGWNEMNKKRIRMNETIRKRCNAFYKYISNWPTIHKQAYRRGLVSIQLVTFAFY